MSWYTAEFASGGDGTQGLVIIRRPLPVQLYNQMFYSVIALKCTLNDCHRVWYLTQNILADMKILSVYVSVEA